MCETAEKRTRCACAKDARRRATRAKKPFFVKRFKLSVLDDSTKPRVVCFRVREEWPVNFSVFGTPEGVYTRKTRV